jgi:ketosteroid isomerase-like protein
MSSANLEFVRSIYAAWERGDWSSTDWADPEIEFVIADGPDPSSWSGVPALVNAWRGFMGAWEEYRGEPQEYSELDGERVYVLLRVSGRGRTSGLEMARMSANLFTIRSGKVTRLAIYWDSENALADLASTPEA